MVNYSTNQAIASHWIQKWLRHLTLEIQVLDWDRHKNVAKLNQLTGSHSYLLMFTQLTRSHSYLLMFTWLTGSHSYLLMFTLTGSHSYLLMFTWELYNKNDKDLLYLKSSKPQDPHISDENAFLTLNIYEGNLWFFPLFFI